MPPSICVNRLEMASLYPFEKGKTGLIFGRGKFTMFTEGADRTKGWPRIGTEGEGIDLMQILLDPGNAIRGLKA